jgi:ubiquinone/menaquinone biosynthesis C-methylase UbiE
MNNHDRVCPVERANSLDNTIRKYIQNPQKILSPYIKKGMTVLDVGCGPGFFSIEIAKMVGESGKVIAADLQEGMLEKLKNKIHNTKLEEIISLHKCEKDKIGVLEKLDFVLIFYMLHEVPNHKNFLQEIKSILKPNGKVFIIEPKFHVSQKGFIAEMNNIKEIGFEVIEKPKVFFSRSVLVKNIN